MVKGTCFADFTSNMRRNFKLSLASDEGTASATKLQMRFGMGGSHSRTHSANGTMEHATKEDIAQQFSAFDKRGHNQWPSGSEG
jgi:hypothetical protein